MKKLLQLSTYPIANPLHGGQIRVSEIRRYFERHGWEVKSLSLSTPSHSGYTQDDYLLDDSSWGSLVPHPFCGDYATALLSDKGVPYEFLKKKILHFQPDMISLEQPWLFPAIKRLQSEGLLSPNTLIIHSSQNVEFQTKHDLLKSHHALTPETLQVIERIKELESDLCHHAHATIACTASDATTLQAMGAKNLLIASNGVSKRPLDPLASQVLLEALCGRRYILFVGSAYPPNALGFWELLGDSLAFLPPDTLLLLAGGVSNIIDNYTPPSAKLYDFVNQNRLCKLGFISDSLLGALLHHASVIILPITVGGGSNLKTAEAIAAARPVVATTTACRGFEVDSLSDFLIADDSPHFISAITKLLNQPSTAPLDHDPQRSKVYWDKTLKPLQALL